MPRTTLVCPRYVEYLESTLSMDTGSDYYISWLIYCLAVFSSNALLWRLLVRASSVHLKILLQLTLLAVLMTPASLELGTGYWVPAFMMMIMEGLNEGFAAAAPRLLPMLLVLILLIFSTYLSRWTWRRLFSGKFSSR